MADCTEIDVFEGFRTKWATSGLLIGWIPPGRVHHANEWGDETQYPLARLYINGTPEMNSGDNYIQKYAVTIELQYKGEEEQRNIALREIRRLFIGTKADPTAGLVIENATVLHSMPDPSGVRFDGETVNGVEIQKLIVGFNVLVQCTRG